MSLLVRRVAVGAGLTALVACAVAATTAVTSTSDPAATPAAAAAPGQPYGAPTSDFTSIKPCRIADTRATTAGPLTAGSTRTLAVSASSLATQGGATRGCGVPARASSVVVTLTAVGAAGAGYVEAWAAGTPDPGVSTLQYSPGLTLSGGYTVPVSSTGLAVQSFAANVHLVVDVTGYHAPARIAFVGKDGSVYSPTGGFQSPAGHPQTGLYFLNADDNLDGCAVDVTPGLALVSAQASSINGSIRIETYGRDSKGRLVPADGEMTVSAVC